MQADFEEATAEAEELVAETTGLRSLSGPARARVTDRAGWVGANVASFQRLLKPITAKLGDKMEGSRTGGLARQVGNESGRGRECQDVWIQGVTGTYKKKKHTK